MNRDHFNWIDTKDIFVYTFASPNVYKNYSENGAWSLPVDQDDILKNNRSDDLLNDTRRKKDDENIFNIVNLKDSVP